MAENNYKTDIVIIDDMRKDGTNVTLRRMANGEIVSVAIRTSNDKGAYTAMLNYHDFLSQFSDFITVKKEENK